MQKGDIHGPATGAIAKAAGFTQEDVQLIAWACWATDVCPCTQVIYPWQVLYNNPGPYFHFLPGDGKNPLVTTANCKCAQALITWAKDKGLIALGIALHSLQDTYSHHGWVGKLAAHNVLPPWVRGRWTWPFPYGHSALAKTPDVVDAVWYDPRANIIICNRWGVMDCLDATVKVLMRTIAPSEIYRVAHDVKDYNKRKTMWLRLAGMPGGSFNELHKTMWPKHKAEFKAAAAEQKRFVKEWMKLHLQASKQGVAL